MGICKIFLLRILNMFLFLFVDNFVLQRTLEVLTIIVSGTQLLCTGAIHAGVGETVAVERPHTGRVWVSKLRERFIGLVFFLQAVYTKQSAWDRVICVLCVCSHVFSSRVIFFIFILFSIPWLHTAPSEKLCSRILLSLKKNEESAKLKWLILVSVYLYCYQ